MPRAETQPPQRPKPLPRLSRRRLGLAAALMAVGAAALLVNTLRTLAASHAQIAVFRPTTGEWIVRADDQTTLTVAFGQKDDVPVPRDYQGTGSAQIAVFRPSTLQWLIRSSSG